MAKSKRREGRVTALMFLFSADWSKPGELEGRQLESALEGFWEFRPARTTVREHATQLIRGVLAKRPELDRLLEGAAANYALERIAPVDRNILRIALFEMTAADPVPAPVAINEAVEIAAEYGDTSSGAFVNGVLDGIRRSGALSVNDTEKS